MSKYKQMPETTKDDVIINTLDEVSEMYLKEKQRADRAEKRWSELKEKLKEFSQEAWDKGMVNHADAYAMTLEDMQQLEEDDE